jgi:hypothetical protein
MYSSLSAVAGVVLAACFSTLARAESSDGGRTTAGGLFMPYTSSPLQPVRAPARARAPRRSHAPASLSEAVSLGALSPSEAASLQSIADGQY